MTILESKPTELVRIRLEFLKPFAAKNTTTFTFTPSGGEDQVTWKMEGHNSSRQGLHPVHGHGQDGGRRFRARLTAMKSGAEAEAKKAAEAKAEAEAKAAAEAAAAAQAAPPPAEGQPASGLPPRPW